MSSININVNEIVKNLENHEIENIVCKSNLYGFGYELLKYIKRHIRKITIADVNEFSSCYKYMGNEVEYVVLYSDIENEFYSFWERDNVKFCINNLKQLKYIEENSLPKSRFYIRIDEFLGMHGLSLKEVESRTDISMYKGILVHINEFLSDEERKIIHKIELLAERNQLQFSLGGSNAYNYLAENEKIEYRYVARLFETEVYSPIQLNLNILEMVHLNGRCVEIGYKSDRKKICEGTLFLADIGYGSWSIITDIYRNNGKLHFGNYALELPAYPCMNTAWFYCKDKVPFCKTVSLFKTISEIETLCLELDIDRDELYTSFREDIKRIYIN